MYLNIFLFLSKCVCMCCMFRQIQWPEEDVGCLDLSSLAVLFLRHGLLAWS